MTATTRVRLGPEGVLRARCALCGKAPGAEAVAAVGRVGLYCSHECADQAGDIPALRVPERYWSGAREERR